MSSRRGIVCGHTAFSNAPSEYEVLHVPGIELIPINFASVAVRDAEEERAAQEADQVVLLGNDLP